MAPNVKLHFFPAQEVNGSVLHEITDEDPFFKRLKLRPERDGLGGAELVLARGIGFAGFGSGTFNSEVFVRVIIPAYSDTVYYPWGFFLGKRQQIVVHVDEDGAEEFHFGGPGPKQYLDRSGLGIEQLTGTGWNLDLENGVWRWNESATVGRILNRIYQEDQARDDPALPDLTLGFDASDDSDGNPWTDSDLGGPEQFELPIGHSLLKALWDIDDVVELTSWVDLGTVATPKFELNVKEGLGDDNTGSSFGAGVALIREGVNIANRSLETEGVSLRKASHVIVEGKDGAWAEAVRPGFVSGNYVKYAKISYPRTNTPFWLEKAGIRWLKRQDYGEKELQVEILPGASDATGDYFPAPDRVLWLSNLISLDTSADGLTHSPLDIQPSEDQLVTGFELDTHTASDDTDATAKARSWTVTVYLNRERPGSIAKAPDQRSAASGGGCQCHGPAPLPVGSSPGVESYDLITGEINGTAHRPVVTVGGADRLLLFIISTDCTTAPTITADYTPDVSGGAWTGLTLISKVLDTSGNRCYVYGLWNPTPSGLAPRVRWTLSGTCGTRKTVSAVVVTGYDADPSASLTFGSTAWGSGGATTGSSNATAAAEDLVLAQLHDNHESSDPLGGVRLATGTDQLMLDDSWGSKVWGGLSSQPGAGGSTASSFQWSYFGAGWGGNYGHIAQIVLPGSSGGHPESADPATSGDSPFYARSDHNHYHSAFLGLTVDDHPQYVDYDNFTAAGDTLRGTGPSAAQTIKNNIAGTAAPGVGDDEDDGYAVGSRWLDTTNDKEYVALDVTTGAAVWVETTVTGASHTHGGIGEILISDTPSTPLVFADLLQNEAENDLLYGDV